MLGEHRKAELIAEAAIYVAANGALDDEWSTRYTQEEADYIQQYVVTLRIPEVADWLTHVITTKILQEYPLPNQTYLKYNEHGERL